MKKEFFIGVVVAVVCAVGAKSLDWATSGGIVHLLGGYTKEEYRKNNLSHHIMSASARYRIGNIRKCMATAHNSINDRNYKIDFWGDNFIVFYKKEDNKLSVSGSIFCEDFSILESETKAFSLALSITAPRALAVIERDRIIDEVRSSTKKAVDK